MIKATSLTVSAFTLMLISGCGALQQSTGVMQMGADSYRVMARPTGGNALRSQSMAMEQATAHCAALQSQIQVTSSKIYGPTAGSLEGAFEVSFSCKKMPDQTPDPKS